jgi:hypothetical protein
MYDEDDDESFASGMSPPQKRKIDDAKLPNSATLVNSEANLVGQTKEVSGTQRKHHLPPIITKFTIPDREWDYYVKHTDRKIVFNHKPASDCKPKNIEKRKGLIRQIESITGKDHTYWHCVPLSQRPRDKKFPKDPIDANCPLLQAISVCVGRLSRRGKFIDLTSDPPDAPAQARPNSDLTKPSPIRSSVVSLKYAQPARASDCQLEFPLADSQSTRRFSAALPHVLNTDETDSLFCEDVSTETSRNAAPRSRRRSSTASTIIVAPKHLVHEDSPAKFTTMTITAFIPSSAVQRSEPSLVASVHQASPAQLPRPASISLPAIGNELALVPTRSYSDATPAQTTTGGQSIMASGRIVTFQHELTKKEKKIEIERQRLKIMEMEMAVEEEKSNEGEED